MLTSLSNTISSTDGTSDTLKLKQSLGDPTLMLTKFPYDDSPNDFLHQAIRQLKHLPYRILLKLDENKAVIFFVPTQINEFLYNVFLSFSNKDSITLSEEDFKKMIFHSGIIRIKNYPEKLKNVKRFISRNPPMRQDKIVHCIFRHCDNPKGKPIGYENFVRVLFRLSRYLFRRYRFRDEEMINAVVLALARSPTIQKLLKKKIQKCDQYTNTTKIHLASVSTMTDEKGVTKDFLSLSKHQGMPEKTSTTLSKTSNQESLMKETLNKETSIKNVNSLLEKKTDSIIIKKKNISQENFDSKKNPMFKNEFIPKKELILKKDPILKNALIPKKELILKKDNILKSELISKKELILKKDPILKNELIPKKELILKKDNILKSELIPKKELILKKDNILKSELIPKKELILKKDPILKSELLLKKEFILKKDLIVPNNSILKKDSIVLNKLILKKKPGSDGVQKLSPLNEKTNETSPIQKIHSPTSNTTIPAFIKKNNNASSEYQSFKSQSIPQSSLATSPLILKKNIASTTNIKDLNIRQTTGDFVKNSDNSHPAVSPPKLPDDQPTGKNLTAQYQPVPPNASYVDNTKQVSVLKNNAVLTTKEKEAYSEPLDSMLKEVEEDDVWFDKKMYEIFRLYADNKRGEIPLMTHQGFQGTLLCLKVLFDFVSDSGLAESFYFEELFFLYHDVCEEQMVDPEEGITFLDFRKIFEEVGVDFFEYIGRDQHKKKLIYYWIIRNYFIPLLEHYYKTSHETEKFPYHVMDHQRRIVQNDNITPVPSVLIQEDGTVVDKHGHQLPGPIYSLDDRIIQPAFTSNVNTSNLSCFPKKVSYSQKPYISFIENDTVELSPTVTFKPSNNDERLVQHLKDGMITLSHFNEHSIKAGYINQEGLESNSQNQNNLILNQPEYFNNPPNVLTTTQDCSLEERPDSSSAKPSTNLIPLNPIDSFGAQNLNRNNPGHISMEGEDMHYSPTPYIITSKGEVQNAENGDILFGFSAGHNNTILGPDDRPVWNARITPTGHVELLTPLRFIKSSVYLDNFLANWYSDNDTESLSSGSSGEMHKCHVSQNFDCGKRFRMPLPASLKRNLFGERFQNSGVRHYTKFDHPQQFVQSPNFASRF